MNKAEETIWIAEQASGGSILHRMGYSYYYRIDRSDRVVAAKGNKKKRKRTCLADAAAAWNRLHFAQRIDT